LKQSRNVVNHNAPEDERRYHRCKGGTGREILTQCHVCSRWFWVVRQKARYCSAACRMRAMRRRKRVAKGKWFLQGEHREKFILTPDQMRRRQEQQAKSRTRYL
jgi:hypothetical protein